ncbi:hypothetical protein [Pedococcus soli]
MDTAPTSRPDESGWYEIRLRGRLEPRWATRFEGMALTTRDGFSQLSGPVADQAALHGLLQQLRDLGLPLASVTQPDHGTHPVHHGTTPTHRSLT